MNAHINIHTQIHTYNHVPNYFSRSTMKYRWIFWCLPNWCAHLTSTTATSVTAHTHTHNHLLPLDTRNPKMRTYHQPKAERSRWHAWISWRNHDDATASTSARFWSASAVRPWSWRTLPVCHCPRPARRRPVAAATASECRAACLSWPAAVPSIGTNRRTRIPAAVPASAEVASHRSIRRQLTVAARRPCVATIPPRACPSWTRPAAHRASPKPSVSASSTTTISSNSSITNSIRISSWWRTVGLKRLAQSR